MGAGATETDTFTWSCPSTAGTYTIKAIADATGKVSESNEGNNEKTYSITCTAKPDLVIYSLTPSTTTPTIGQSVTFTVVTKNQGAASTGTFSYDYYYAGNTKFDEDQVGILGVSATETDTFTWTCPSTAGTYTIKAKADATGRVSESDEGNNEKTYSITCTAKPDLVIYSLTPSTTTPTTGQSVTFTVVTKNQGAASTGTYSYDYYYAGNTKFDEDYVGVLGAGATETDTFTWTCPSTAGTYTIKAKADATGRVSESDEGNNEKIYSITCTAKPDLVIESLTPSTITPTTGQSVTFTVVTKNQGTVSTGTYSYTYYYQGSTYLGSIYVATLGAGSSQKNTFAWTCPSTAGTYTIKAKADATGRVNESKEGNNEKTYSIECKKSKEQILTTALTNWYNEGKSKPWYELPFWAAGQIVGIAKGVWEVVKESIQGLIDFLNPFNAVNTIKMLVALVQGLISDVGGFISAVIGAVIDPIIDHINKNEIAEAVGRILGEIVTSVVNAGAKAVAFLGKILGVGSGVFKSMMLVALKAEFNHIDDAVKAGKMSASEVKILKDRIDMGDTGAIFEAQAISKYTQRTDITKIELEVLTGSDNKKIDVKYTKTDGTIKYVEMTSIENLDGYSKIRNAILHGVGKVKDTTKTTAVEIDMRAATKIDKYKDPNNVKQAVSDWFKNTKEGGDPANNWKYIEEVIVYTTDASGNAVIFTVKNPYI